MTFFGPQVLIFRSDLLETGIIPANPYPAVGSSSHVAQTPWNWDLGRGTLQTLGQSYLYLDERGIADGKMNAYRVMIDGGNELMTEEARQGIGNWVRGGGTFMALPFTGRSSLTKSNSWHIQELTGCEIGKLRTPGSGTVTIKANQSVFKTSAGKHFPDQGSSIDWVGNELNQLSVELKPGADCEVLATYENGEPAVVKRRLGQGAVITFGSAFWRNSRDRNGIWWPKEQETEFVGDLLNGLGQPALCETDGNTDLAPTLPLKQRFGLGDSSGELERRERCFQSAKIASASKTDSTGEFWRGRREGTPFYLEKRYRRNHCSHASARGQSGSSVRCRPTV